MYIYKLWACYGNFVWETITVTEGLGTEKVMGQKNKTQIEVTTLTNGNYLQSMFSNPSNMILSIT